MYRHSDMINRIKIEKQQKGFTNAKLSELTGIPIGTLNKILSGDSQDPHVSSIIKIAQALDVSADYIILGKTQFNSNNYDTAMTLYRQLDIEDRAEIRGEMKQMLKADKYRKNDIGTNDEDTPIMRLPLVGRDGTNTVHTLTGEEARKAQKFIEENYPELK